MKKMIMAAAVALIMAIVAILAGCGSQETSSATVSAIEVLPTTPGPHGVIDFAIGVPADKVSLSPVVYLSLQRVDGGEVTGTLVRTDSTEIAGTNTSVKLVNGIAQVRFVEHGEGGYYKLVVTTAIPGTNPPLTTLSPTGQPVPLWETTRLFGVTGPAPAAALPAAQ